MIDITQRDLPYLVLTVDPILQAYRTDRIAGVEQSCPKPDGDLICDQVSYAPWLDFTPATATATGANASGEDDGSSPLLFVLIAGLVVVLAIGAFIVIRRRRADREAIEV
jgi:MYXO-CTERM domain-containing protein